MERELMQQFVTASLRFRKVDFCDLSQESIHIGELVVMEHVYNSGLNGGARLDMAEMQRRLHVSKPAVSQILNSLEKKGCITRRIDPADRRKIWVCPTPKGVAILKASEQNYDKVLSEMIARLGAENVKKLVALINQITEIAEQIKTENME